jgi:VIT family
MSMEVKNTTSDKPTSSDIARYRANYLSEQEGAYLYNKLAEAESDAHLAELYQRLAAIEQRHSDLWKDYLTSAGGNELRAAVLGASDGLTSNLSLVMGVAGATLTGHAVLISGLAGCWQAHSRCPLGNGSPSRVRVNSTCTRSLSRARS